VSKFMDDAARESLARGVRRQRSAGADARRGEPRDREARAGKRTAGEQTLSPRRSREVLARTEQEN
jgi:hypothetical protein